MWSVKFDDVRPKDNHTENVIIVPPTNAPDSAFSHVFMSLCASVSLCACPVRAVTVKSLDLEHSFSVFRYVCKISR